MLNKHTIWENVKQTIIIIQDSQYENLYKPFIVLTAIVSVLETEKVLLNKHWNKAKVEEIISTL